MAQHSQRVIHPNLAKDANVTPKTANSRAGGFFKENCLYVNWQCAKIKHRKFTYMQCYTHPSTLQIQIQAVFSQNCMYLNWHFSRGGLDQKLLVSKLAVLEKINTANLDTSGVSYGQCFALIPVFSLFSLDLHRFTLPGNSLLIWEQYWILSFFQIPVDS